MLELDDNPKFFRAPAITGYEAGVPFKHDFLEVFDIPDFSGTFKKKNMKVGRKGIQETVEEVEVIIHGVTPDENFLQKHNLNQFSNSQEWMSAFLPLQQHKSKENKWHLGQVISYTTLKAKLMNAGQKNGPYPNFIKFTTEDIEKHVFIYVFHGISPSLGIEMKFKTQDVDPINGNDAIAEQFINHNGTDSLNVFYLCKILEFIHPHASLTPILNLINFSNMCNKSLWKLGYLVS